VGFFDVSLFSTELLCESDEAKVCAGFCEIVRGVVQGPVVGVFAGEGLELACGLLLEVRCTDTPNCCNALRVDCYSKLIHRRRM
jgi:hypothetical protein